MINKIKGTATSLSNSTKLSRLSFLNMKEQEIPHKKVSSKDGREQSRGALEVHQYLVDDTECEVPLLKRLIAEPITVNQEEYHRYAPHKVHYFSQCP